MGERELGAKILCCRGSCCSWHERTATAVVDVMEGDIVNEITGDEDKTSDDAADVDDNREGTTGVLGLSQKVS